MRCQGDTPTSYHRTDHEAFDDHRLAQPTLTSENVEETSLPRTQKEQRKRSSDLAPTIPRGCIIVVDTREQAPYDFGGRVETVRLGLATGDYSLLGFETVISVERKSLDDYVGSLTQGRDRFLRECERLSALPVKAVVVEGTLADIAHGRYRSQAAPQSIVGSSIKLITDFGLPVVFADSRTLAERFVERLLTRWYAKHGLSPEPSANKGGGNE